MKTLKEKYQELCETPSDINEHLPILKEYASECHRITEMGVRGCVSIYAMLMGYPLTVTGYDIIRHPNVDEVEKLATENGTEFIFIKANVLEIEIDPTDFLLIDTFHTASQLEKELKIHARKVRKYIGFHDTFTFWENGELPYEELGNHEGLSCGRGLKYALEPFLEAHPEWKIVYKTDKNNGLTIIERV